MEVVIMRHWLPETYNHFGRASELIPSFDKNASDHFVRLRSISVPLLIHIVSRSSLGGEHGERFAFVNDRFATASGGDPKDRH
ncbi:hypothetical protein [Methyloferula stellata]|uniref:hypothetical protein n=1 Tax=Methyloferula stellata TaxID=876270 RepID=UPI00137571A0|nr:hypothetical protein [Methyloferula stellata]